ncbi:hypothetical protein AAFF_G00435760 [Aldrovandia affinis]|uniref:Uncharacterized protein n=1 Tax=Aldrovandia affinis TaxID=143900 RepID=A0AAD7VY39_9TELE|nr:hypothetical protein AAFF_G00435760 [Aldrovandia affinis]
MQRCRNMHSRTLTLPSYPISQIEETVLTFVCQNGHYDKLVKSRLFPLLRQHVASSGHHNQVKDLVDYLVSRNCFPPAPQYPDPDHNSSSSLIYSCHSSQDRILLHIK